MIPPFLIQKATALAAPLLAKLSSPLVKWGFILGVLLFSNLWTWHTTKLNGERERADAVAEQARIFSMKEAQIVESRENVLRQRNDTERATNQKIIDLQKRLVNYERNAKKSNVPIPPDSVGMFNAISGLLPPANDLPRADTATREPNEPSEAHIETTQLLLAYVRAYSDCAGQLMPLWDDYDALVNLLRAEHKLKKAEP